MGPPAHAGAKWRVGSIIASLIGMAVEHEVNDLYRLDTTAPQHRLANVTNSAGRAPPPGHFSNLSSCTSGKSTASRG